MSKVHIPAHESRSRHLDALRCKLCLDTCYISMQNYNWTLTVLGGITFGHLLNSVEITFGHLLYSGKITFRHLLYSVEIYSWTLVVLCGKKHLDKSYYVWTIVLITCKLHFYVLIAINNLHLSASYICCVWTDAIITLGHWLEQQWCTIPIALKFHVKLQTSIMDESSHNNFDWPDYVVFFVTMAIALCIGKLLDYV